MGRKKRIGLTLLLVMLAVCMFALPAQAASKKYVNKWRTVNGKYYYYNSKGKKVTGLKKISGKYYLFDKKGVQLTGWRKVNNHYYYFYRRLGNKAYAAKSRTVNGIRINSSYHADKKGNNLRKLKIMVNSSNIVDRITKPTMTKKQKLRACFDYVNEQYPYYIWRDFANTSDWELTFAEDMYLRGRGDCISYSCTLAFLASAIGLKDVNVVCSGVHGWAEINGKIYDPNFAVNSTADSFFGMDYKLSGIGGRPVYAPCRIYVKKI